MVIFRRQSQPAPETSAGIPAAEQRPRIRESDRRNYTSHGYRALNSYSYASDIVPGMLRRLIHDQLTDRDPPARSAVQVGVHDVDLEHGVASVLGVKYRRSMGTIGQNVPFSGRNTLQERQLTGVGPVDDSGHGDRCLSAVRHHRGRLGVLTTHVGDGVAS